jgi:hypothetical protein
MKSPKRGHDGIVFSIATTKLFLVARYLEHNIPIEDSKSSEMLRGVRYGDML